MLLTDVIGNLKVKKSLSKSLSQQRVPHSKLFFGSRGSGALPLAIAFARLVLCQNKADNNSCHIKASKFQHPDLHFIYPVSQTKIVKTKAISQNFILARKIYRLPGKCLKSPKNL